MLTSLFTVIQDHRRTFLSRRERRLHKRALAYWESMRRERQYPLLKTFSFLDREELADHAFLLDVRGEAAPTFASAGSVLCEEAELDQAPTNLDDACPNSLLRRFAEMWVEVAVSGAPYIAEYEFETDAGYKVSCRGVLLPLSSCGKELDWVLGVVSWKSELSATSSPRRIEDAGLLTPG